MQSDSFELSVVRVEEEGGNRLVERERPNRDGAKMPENSLAVRQLRKLRDTVRRAVSEQASSMPTTIVRTYLTTRSIFDIATELKQDAMALIQVNPRLENVLAIPARTPVLVFNG